jgi:hypothetical protein
MSVATECEERLSENTNTCINVETILNFITSFPTNVQSATHDAYSKWSTYLSHTRVHRDKVIGLQNQQEIQGLKQRQNKKTR